MIKLKVGCTVDPDDSRGTNALNHPTESTVHIQELTTPIFLYPVAYGQSPETTLEWSSNHCGFSGKAVGLLSSLNCGERKSPLYEDVRVKSMSNLTTCLSINIHESLGKLRYFEIFCR